MKGAPRAVRIALIPFYVDYYETVVSGIRQSKERLVAKTVATIGPGHEVLLGQYVTDSPSAVAAVDWLRGQRPDCLVVLPLVATFSALSDQVVKGWSGPLVLLSAMAGTSVPRPITMTKVVAESQAFGTQAVANGWMRSGRIFHVVHQIPGSQAGNSALRSLLDVIAAARELSRLRIGLIGKPFERMTDIELPAKQFSARTGVHIVRVRMQRIHDVMRNVSRTELRVFGQKLSTIFSIGRLSAQEKEISLRAALAIQKTVTDEKLSCAAFNSHGPDGLNNRNLGLMCSLGVSLATSTGCPVSEVGDLCTAFAMWLGRRLSGASFYTELDSSYISAHDWLLLNSGEFDLAWLRKGFKPKLRRNANFQGVNGRGASVCAPLRVGPATIVNFTPTPKDDKPYRIQFCEGTIKTNWCPELGVGNAFFKVKGDARAVYERWLTVGPVHHSATCPGRLGNLLRLFCRLQGWTSVHVS
jgi:L-arabinose isomerase